MLNDPISKEYLQKLLNEGTRDWKAEANWRPGDPLPPGVEYDPEWQMQRGAPYWLRKDAHAEMEAERIERERREAGSAGSQEAKQKAKEQEQEKRRRAIAAHHGMTPEETEEYLKTGKFPSRLHQVPESGESVQDSYSPNFNNLISEQDLRNLITDIITKHYSK